MTDRVDQLIREIAAEARTIGGRVARSGIAPRVLEAMRRVPRDRFVPDVLVERAYENRPLPIGQEQTISQPFIVALMTHLLELPENARVLDVGTGSGYQAAVLAQLAAEVYSIEIEPRLSESAAKVLTGIGCDNVRLRVGDGHLGWPEAAPFDGILVAAAAEAVPRALTDQLAPGGRIVLPLDYDAARKAEVPAPLRWRPSDWFGSFQQLVVVTRAADGSLHQEDIIPVAFVPFRHPAERG